MNKETNQLTQEQGNTNITVGQAFVEKVIREFGTDVGEIKAPPEMKRLIQGYFMGCDGALREAEKSRAQDRLPYSWANVEINSALAQNILNFARLGLDMCLPNQLFAVPYLDSKKNKYTFTFMPGYKGRELIIRKYAVDEIVDVTVELVYSNDEFKALKKDARHPQDTYEFTVVNPFERGHVIGGFAYIRFADERKNILVIMSKADIDKRRDKAKSKTFWGSWYGEMALKTILIQAAKKVTIDPKKIDDTYKMLMKNDEEGSEQLINAEIADKANRVPINIDAIVVDEPAAAQISQQTSTNQIPLPNDVIANGIGTPAPAAVQVKSAELFSTPEKPGF